MSSTLAKHAVYVSRASNQDGFPTLYACLNRYGQFWLQVNNIIEKNVSDQVNKVLIEAIHTDFFTLIKYSAFRKFLESITGKDRIVSDFSWAAAIGFASQGQVKLQIHHKRTIKWGH